MNLECILHQDLEAYLVSEKYLRSEVLPISRHRGLSHIHNPKALPTDVVLINIYEKNQLVAYLGLLPDNLFLEGKKVHVGWLSCMWVSPNSRGKGFAKTLLQTAWDKWNKQLTITDFTPPAEALYNKLGYFNTLESKEGIKCYNHLNLAFFLPKKNKKWNLIRIPLLIIDAIFNFFWISKNRLFSQKPSNQLSIKKTTHIDEKTLTFISSFQKKSIMPRGKMDFEWLENFPWLNNSVAAKEDQKRYYFSSFAQRFEIIYLNFFERDKIVGCLVLALRDDALKVPFVYFDEQNDTLAKNISIHLLNFMESEKMSTIAISNATLTKKILEQKHRFFLVRRYQKKYFISKKIYPHTQTTASILQDGDGDAAFT